MIEKVSFLIFFMAVFARSAVFNAWDDNKGLEDQTISSKISSKKFVLKVASLTDDGKSYKDFTGTVCVKLRDKKGVFNSGWINLQFDGDSYKSVAFKVDKAVGDDNSLRAEMEYDEKKGLTCPLENGGLSKESFFSDAFCVRPYRFGFFLKDKMFISQKEYFFEKALKALDYEGNVVENYEKSLVLEYEKLNRKGDVDGSLAGNLKSLKISFKKGEGDIKLYFDDTAFLRLILKDDDFCKEDRKDTALKDREIYGEEKVFFKIDRFSLSFLKKPFIKDAFSDFTYLSRDLNHSASFCNLSVSIKAEGARGEILKNYKDPKDIYFADPLDINATLSVSVRENLLKKDFPNSFVKEPIPFKDGEAVLRYEDAKFNYAKDYLRPKNPFFVRGKDCNISIEVEDGVYKSAKGKAFSKFDNEALFYYASFEVGDLKSDLKEVSHEAFIDVYCDKECDKYFKNFEERRINWFLNEDDNETSLDKTDFFPKPSVSMKDTVSPYVGIKEVEKADGGVVRFKVFSTSSESLSSYIHIKIPSWLWHGSYYDYNFSLDSDCSFHPCFLYIRSVNGKSGVKDIESGKYEETAGGEYNGTIKKRFLKVFR